MSLHHTLKIKDFRYFLGFRHSFRGLTPLKFINFDQKFKISNNTQNFAQRPSLESMINRPLHHTTKTKDFNFFWISSLFSWANTFKIQEIRQKIQTFPTTLKILHNVHPHKIRSE